MRYSTLERAFQLAEQGPATSIEEIRSALTAEGYGDAVSHTGFPTVRKQLREAIQKRGEAESESAPADTRPRIEGRLRLSC